MTNVGFYFEPEAYSADTRLLMGRQAAGAAFLRAYAQTRPAEAWCFSRETSAAETFRRALGEFGATETQVHWVGIHNLADLAAAGLLYRPDPAIAADAWRRLQHATPRAYSLCGITHTTATHAVMEVFAQLLTAPLEEWDAVICTSIAVRDSVRVIVESQADYLRERLGAERLCLPQLPVIPLGVHAEDFAATEEERAAGRQALGIGHDETVFLYVGRLSYVNKAHPLPMFLGLEACAADAKVTLIQVGWFETAAVEQAFKADAAQLCPSVRCLHVDGREAAPRRQAWAAADVFTSLSDSIQETFGLTPIEAMAAGLPVVVSDWDGYKDTVRDGIDGFKVPTMAMPAGAGQSLADRYDFGLDSYHVYCGVVSQLVAVNVAAAAEAYRRLIHDPGLRRRMGAAGQARAREQLDWRVMFGRYEALWDDLAGRRRAAPQLHPALSRRVRPDRADPFTVFASYPSAIIAPTTLIRRLAGATPEHALARRGLATVSFASLFLPEPDLVAAVLASVPTDGWMHFDAIRTQLANPPLTVAAAVLWLGKVGLLELQPHSAA